MKNKENIFLKIGNWFKDVREWLREALEEDINGEERLSREEAEELAKIKTIEEEVHKGNRGFVKSATINETVAKANAKAKSKKNINPRVLGDA